MKKGIVLGHVISSNGIEVEKAKIDLITSLLLPTCVKKLGLFLDISDFTLDLFRTSVKLLSPYPVF